MLGAAQTRLWCLCVKQGGFLGDIFPISASPVLLRRSSGRFGAAAPPVLQHHPHLRTQTSRATQGVKLCIAGCEAND